MPNSKVNILIVDDHWENLLALEAILISLGQNIVKASSGEEALKCLLQNDFAVILLDVQMPGMDGFETASLIRQRDRTRSTPIIFLTAFSKNENFMFKGYSLGAVDYLIKPLEPEILLSKVTVFVELFQATIALKKSEEQFRSLSACSPVGIFVIDIEARCTYTNPRFQSIFDQVNEASFPEGWLEFVHPQDRDQTGEQWLTWIQKKQEYSQEFRLNTPSNLVRWVKMKAAPMISSDGDLLGHVGTIEDITDRKQAEEARAQFIREQAARQQAEEANRLKDEFLATLSHELRTPLNSILGWSKLLRNQKFSEDKTRKALETIERNAKLQAKLIEDILDISRIIIGKMQLNRVPVNIISVVEAAIDDLYLSFAEKEIDLNFKHSQSLASKLHHSYWVAGDARRLQQIIWNLLSNAIKFTPQGGAVEVELLIETSPEKAQNNFNFKDLSTNSWVVIQVTDTGIGIPGEFLPYVFDRFRQADGKTTKYYGGLGLGLAIVRNLVEMQGGTVAVESAGENQGATFSVQFPLLDVNLDSYTPPENLETAEGVIPQAESVLAGLRVLVVDDDSDTRELLIQVLREYDIEVQAVASVQTAIATIEHSLPDLIISDICMPDEDGYSLIQKLRSLELTHEGRLPVIAVSAFTHSEAVNQAMTEGFDGYLSKPVLPGELVSTITRLMQETQYRYVSKSKEFQESRFTNQFTA
ncbi:Hybrid signal transduction histidine kinase D [Planktothrix tepida]|uniref:Circadian input-output histidine kinase CikA n=1 Tax=Planktothrix tepida PCC 9214 TaxID=671072 RepID=A0A1J1LPA5_9CYAN|nr:response regulator [Planktothrix tepida]CAD5973680.1 Hybrid signal transduction histidine kinase D [Planktothrix tepida]CUR34405.1 PAS/PAC sensor hybrid histidine kinase [Planktothrix tepida PCC 9214]